MLVAPDKVVTVNQLHVETHTATDTERLVKAGGRLWLSPESALRDWDRRQAPGFLACLLTVPGQAPALA